MTSLRDTWLSKIALILLKKLLRERINIKTKPLISEPTHLLPNSLPCIDLIFTDKPNLVVDSGVRPSLCPNCHHQIFFCKFNLMMKRHLKLLRRCANVSRQRKVKFKLLQKCWKTGRRNQDTASKKKKKKEKNQRKIIKGMS